MPLSMHALTFACYDLHVPDPTHDPQPAECFTSLNASFPGLCYAHTQLQDNSYTADTSRAGIRFGGHECSDHPTFSHIEYSASII